MKVLKNNYEQDNYIEEVKKAEPYPRKLICDNCGSELEYEEQDLRIGSFGCVFVDCPLCGRDNLLDSHENEFTLTVDNVEFPTHFFHTSKETGAVDCCNNEEIRKYIRNAINYFRQNKDEFYWYTATGNLHIGVEKWDGDEQYEVIVTNDHYSTFIPFEPEDY